MAPISQSSFSTLDDRFKGKYMTISSFQQEDLLFYSFFIVCLFIYSELFSIFNSDYLTSFCII